LQLTVINRYLEGQVRKKNLNRGVFILALALFAFAPGATDVHALFKWLDEKGVMHITDYPPAMQEEEEKPAPSTKGTKATIKDAKGEAVTGKLPEKPSEKPKEAAKSSETEKPKEAAKPAEAAKPVKPEPTPGKIAPEKTGVGAAPKEPEKPADAAKPAEVGKDAASKTSAPPKAEPPQVLKGQPKPKPRPSAKQPGTPQKESTMESLVSTVKGQPLYILAAIILLPVILLAAVVFIIVRRIKARKSQMPLQPFEEHMEEADADTQSGEYGQGETSSTRDESSAGQDVYALDEIPPGNPAEEGVMEDMSQTEAPPFDYERTGSIEPQPAEGGLDGFQGENPDRMPDQMEEPASTQSAGSESGERHESTMDLGTLIEGATEAAMESGEPMPEESVPELPGGEYEPVTVVEGGLDLAGADEMQSGGELKLDDDAFRLDVPESADVSEEPSADVAEEPVTVVEGGLDLAGTDEMQSGGELKLDDDEFRLDVGDFKLEDQSGLDLKVEENPYDEDLGAKNKKPAKPGQGGVKLEMDG
jgi:hypothetical protein